MITTRRLAGDVWWDAMNTVLLIQSVQRGDLSQLAAIDRMQPKLWIFNYRLAALWPVLKPMILHSYVRVTPNIFLAGAHAGGRPVLLMNRWTGYYSVYDAGGERRGAMISLDGRRVSTPVFLTRGMHRIETAPPGPRSFFLLPSGLPLRVRAPIEGPPLELYEHVYD